MSRLWALLLLSYCALIFYLSSQPMLPVPDLFNMQDKFIHAGAYALMAFLFWRAGWIYVSDYARFTPAFLAFSAVLFAALYGASDEWHQSFVAGRDASFLDWLADLFGALLLTLTLWKREAVAIGRV
ncbi:VanZ family protein [Mariprofundus sp. NF]|uniref:VanZ family protein n=1 Tax=Mariprofundus sp. NF TaxID=2608716 RepID=UPI0015A3A7F8|nr:VanZ family protein [Mariprofundus sp. NF]NWF39173.1 VanZ family protein [Mariprofundus sp. NF]